MNEQAVTILDHKIEVVGKAPQTVTEPLSKSKGK